MGGSRGACAGNGRTGRAFSVLRQDVGLAIAAYVSWCVLTYFWSEVPELTLLKSGALALVGMGLFAGGQYWVVRLGLERALDYLFPILILALFAGVFGQEAIEQSSEGLTLYEGLTNNPNMLGSLMTWRFLCALAKLPLPGLDGGSLVVGPAGRCLGVCAFCFAIVDCGGPDHLRRVSGGCRHQTQRAPRRIGSSPPIGSFMAIPDVYETLEQRYVRKELRAEADILA